MKSKRIKSASLDIPLKREFIDFKTTWRCVFAGSSTCHRYEIPQFYFQFIA